MPPKAHQSVAAYVRLIILLILKRDVVKVMHLLEERYGTPTYSRRFNPMDELISCILSQHTSDANSFPAFYRLRERYPTWEEVLGAGPEAVAEEIRSAGLANQKSKSILRCLNEIHTKTGKFDIDFLGDMGAVQARNWLAGLSGVGPKTASIVLCFAFGMDVIPVDTHVYRVAWRLGLIPEGVGENKAHDLLARAIPPGSAYRIHMDFIQHGRAVCKAPLPRCAECVVRDFCRWLRKNGPERREKELRSTRNRGVSGRGKSGKHKG